MASALESVMALHLRAVGVPEAARQWRFHPTRRWMFDFAWPEHMVAVEVEGGTWSGGRHTRGKGFAADCEKYNTATVLGWRVLRVTGDQVKSGAAVRWVEAILAKGDA